MSPRARGELNSRQRRRIENAAKALAASEAAYRAAVLDALAEGASFAEMSQATGLSTNTLQRWKREASPS